MRVPAAILIFAALFAGSVYGLFLASLPDLDKTVIVDGLRAEVTVEYDQYAIPTIRAEHSIDAFRALGYLHGRDRLWQMEFARMLAQGRLAEILGSAAVPADRYFRTLGLHNLAEASLAHLSDEMNAVLGAYSAGVNAAIEQFPVLPPEFWLFWHKPEPWRPEDSVVWTKLMALDLSQNWRSEHLRMKIASSLGKERTEQLWPMIGRDVPVTLASGGSTGLADDRTLGSNAWAISGARRAQSDQASMRGSILANDPHLAMRIPSLWYLVQIESPDLQFQGATIAGMPVPVLGRNEDLAWGFTNTGSDLQDLVINRLVPGSPDHYLGPNGPHQFQEREETIKVRFGQDHLIKIRTSETGPVISDLWNDRGAYLHDDQVVSLQWTALTADDTTVEAGLHLARAKTIEELLNALKLFKAPQQNVTYATKEGTIGFIAAGRAPKRAMGSGFWPTAADDPAARWRDWIAFEQLPQIQHPPSGMIFNANNPLVDQSYPHDLGREFDSGMRARRLDQLLRDHQMVASPDMAPVQLDYFSTLADDFLPDLLAAIARRQGSDDRAIHATLSSWDKIARADGPEMLIMAGWYHALAARLYGDELGGHFEAYRGIRSTFTRSALDQQSGWCDDVRSLGVETCETIVGLAFDDAMADLREVHGEDWQRWRWGDAHRFRPDHAPASNFPVINLLFQVDLEVGGDSSSINVAHYKSKQPGRFDVIQGPGYRGIYDLNDHDRAHAVIAGGQSGHPLSPHFDDLAKQWQLGGYAVLDLDRHSEAKSAGAQKIAPVQDAAHL